MAGILGILLAGATYVPIPFEAPGARRRLIIERGGCKIIIVDEATLPEMAGYSHAVLLEEALRHRRAMGTAAPSSTAETNGRSAAYVMFTSGSTGTPMGAEIGHEAVLNTLDWMISAFAVTERDRVLQKTVWTFTDSIWELFLPLLVGGRVVFVDDQTVKDPLALHAALAASEVSLTQFVPPALLSFLNVVEHDVRQPGLPSLRWVLNGGEEVPRALVDKWFGLFPHTGYANTYGMTESAIYATCFSMREPPVFGMRRVPIGVAITGATVDVVDASGTCLGVDEVGEICIGGRGLMNRYLGDEGATRRKFIAHPTTGCGIYRTGDLGAWRPDGQLAYLGRLDQQVKIRGFRVEPVEIEHGLLQHEDVEHAAVVARGEGENRALIAFYTAKDQDPGESSLLTHLRRLLPSYQVPSRCVYLETMPLTPHDKVDRRELEERALPPRVDAVDARQTSDDVERLLIEIWREVLGQDDFDLETGFFEAGGNSLLLVRVYAALPDVFHRSVVLADLIQHASIRATARFLRQVATAAPAGPEPGPRRRSVDALESRRALRTKSRSGVNAPSEGDS